MEALFLKIFNMSITAGWIVLAVVLLRLLLKKAPKWISCLLWVLVGLRLVLPFSFESKVSVIPSAETVPQEIIYSEAPMINSGVPFVNGTVNPVISESLAPETGASVNPIQIVIFIASIAWSIGVAGMIIYALVSYLRIKHKVRISAPLRENIYVCDNIGTPFILGIIKPKIYLPSDIGEKEAEYIIAHEKSHLKRRDHLWKPLGFALLTVYWFNPLLWLGYVLLCRDIELACDERVIKEMGAEDKKAYSTALLNCSIPRRMISACPLAFGEVGVKSRIKSVLNYKKPAFWIIVVAVIACVVAAVCLLTDPKKEEKNEDISVSDIVIEAGSELEGVSIDIKSSDFSGYMPYIEIEWTNETEKMLTYGESFALYRYADGEWKDCSVMDIVFNAVGYAVPPNETVIKKYYLTNQDMREAGVYRLETHFLRDGDTLNEQGKIPTYNIWVEFKLEEPIALKNVTDYDAASVVYASSLLSTPDDVGVGLDYRAVSVSGGIALYRKNTLGEYDHLGYMEKTRLSEANFDSLFGAGYWKSISLSARMVRICNEQAWKAVGEDNSIYILTEQNDGRIYLVCGQMGENGNSYVSRVYRLEVLEENENAEPVLGEPDRVIYTYPDSVDFMAPSITLYDNGEFQFVFSCLSSYIAWGSYKMTEDTLILPTSDGLYVYVFNAVNGTFVFDAERSSDIPEFRYSADSYDTKSPVPDGAVFYKVVIDDGIEETADTNEPLSLAKSSIPKTADWKTKGLESAGLDGAEFYSSHDCSFGTLHILTHHSWSQAFMEIFFALERKDDILLYAVTEHAYPEDIYSCDVDGEKGDEIVFMTDDGGNGGAGSHTSYVFKITDNGFKTLFNVNTYVTPFDTGFEYELKAPFKMEVRNTITGYSTVIDYSDNKGYVGGVYDEKGNPLGDWEPSRDCFYKFVPKDINHDGVCEIVCTSYTHLYGHADGIGDSECTLRYNKDSGEFEVIDARFVRYTDFEIIASGDYYTVTDMGNYTYDYDIVNHRGTTLLSDYGLTKEPKIKMVSDSVIGVSVQAGTGISTQYTVYGNIYTGQISPTYWSVLGEYENKVVYTDYEDGQHSIVVQDIFDKNVFYKKEIISEVFVAADPVIDIQISPDGIATITYVKGENYTETEIKIDLTKE